MPALYQLVRQGRPPTGHGGLSLAARTAAWFAAPRTLASLFGAFLTKAEILSSLERLTAGGPLLRIPVGGQWVVGVEVPSAERIARATAGLGSGPGHWHTLY